MWNHLAQFGSDVAYCCTTYICCCCNKKSSDKEKLLSDKEDNASYQTVDVNNAAAVHPHPALSAKERELEQFRQEFKNDISQIFWLMAGHEPYAKIAIYMRKNELQEFLDIVNIYDPKTFDKVFTDMDCEIVNGQIEFTEFVSYFCDPMINAQCNELRDKIIESTDWKLIRKSLKIFDIIDKDHTGEIIYDDFVKFCQLIGITEEEQMQQLFMHIDQDGSKSIKLKELLAWFKERLKNQSQQRRATTMQQ